MKNKTIRQLVSFLIALLLMLDFIGPTGSVLAADMNRPIGTVSVAVEKFTIGQGYFIEPTEMTIYEGDTGATLVDCLLGGKKNYDSTNGVNGFYLASIHDADPTGVAVIPRYISEMNRFAPSTEDNFGNDDVPNLGEFAYSSQSGWMYSVDGIFPNVGLSSYSPADGDVMRLQFTVYGYGSDLGDRNLGTGNASNVAKRDDLTKILAAFNARSDRSQLMKKSLVKEAYENAIAVSTDLEKSQKQVDAALENFEKALVLAQITSISLSPTELSLESGERARLSVATTPASDAADQIRYTSSDPAVAYVDANGFVTAGLPGEATITASLGDLKATAKVTVTKPVVLEGIKLDPAFAQLEVGQELALSLRLIPEDAQVEGTAVYSSSNPAVASVDANGTVTAVRCGEAVITASLNGFTASTKIVVISDLMDGVDAVRELVKSLTDESELSEILTAREALRALNEDQLALMEAGEYDSLLRSVTNRVIRKINAQVEAVNTLLPELSAQIQSESLEGQTILDFVALKDAVETLAVYDLDEDEMTVVNKLIDKVRESQTILGETMKTSNGVTLVSNHPWTVRLVAEKVQADAMTKAEIEKDLRFEKPEILSGYRLRLYDYSDPNGVVELDPEDGVIVTLPIGDFDFASSNLTMIVGSQSAALTQDDYSAEAKTLRLSGPALGETLLFVGDTRVAIEDFRLPGTATLFLDSADPSTILELTGVSPYNTTDLGRAQWSSSNPAVATVDQGGKVTAITTGETTISCTIMGIMRSTVVTVRLNSLVDFESFWPTFRKNNNNMAITDVALPNTNENLTEKWIQESLATANLSTLSTPLMVEDRIFVASGDTLYRLNRENGQVEKQVSMSGKIGFFSYATYADGMIFVPLEGGIIEAFNADTMDSLWKTEAMGGQSLCQLTYHDGYIYSGTWSGGSKENTGKFFCFDTTKNGESEGGIRKAKWVSDDTKGYYWAGATVVGNAVIFGGDSGILQSRDYRTGKLIDSVDVGGMIRSCIAWDDATGAVYFTAGTGNHKSGATEGSVYKVSVSESGKLSGMISEKLPAAATTTPVVYGGRVYVPTGSGFDWEGQMAVLDAENLRTIYTAETYGSSKSSPLLTTAYADDEAGTVYLYMTVNNMDGAIIRMKDDWQNSTPQVDVIYRPDADHREHTTMSLTCDENGTIYYYNDHGQLMALTGTTEAVRESLEAVDNRVLPTPGSSGLSESSWSPLTDTLSSGTILTEEEEPWDFDADFVTPTSGRTRAAVEDDDSFKTAAIILAIFAGILTLLYGGISYFTQSG